MQIFRVKDNISDHNVYLSTSFNQGDLSLFTGPLILITFQRGSQSAGSAPLVLI